LGFIFKEVADYCLSKKIKIKKLKTFMFIVMNNSQKYYFQFLYEKYIFQ